MGIEAFIAALANEDNNEKKYCGVRFASKEEALAHTKRVFTTLKVGDEITFRKHSDSNMMKGVFIGYEGPRILVVFPNDECGLGNGEISPASVIFEE